MSKQLLREIAKIRENQARKMAPILAMAANSGTLKREYRILSQSSSSCKLPQDNIDRFIKEQEQALKK